uniref:Ribosomal protein L16 n=1 Tax=Rhexinema sarcinoideum TaxID=43261 RepID=A0A1B2RYU9_9CHLO|nr:ribosomal protein L16 [Rhexinema sarcinoideum]
MSLQPKTRKYRYCFRNKTNIYKDLLSDIKNRKFVNANFSTLSRDCFATKKKENLSNAFFLPFSTLKENKYEKPFKLLSFAGSFIHFALQANRFFIEKNALPAFTNEWQCNFNPFFSDFFACQQNKNNNFQNFCQKPFLLHEQQKSSKIFFNIYSEATFKKASLQYTKTKTEKFKNNKNDPHICKFFNSFIDQYHKKAHPFSQTYAALDKVRFGTCGFYFCSSGTVSAKFLETIRLEIARKLKKTGRFWIRVCADSPVTARSAETRMGRGKGAISHYEAKVRPGQMFLEFSGISLETIKLIFKKLSKKTPVPVKMVF